MKLLKVARNGKSNSTGSSVFIHIRNQSKIKKKKAGKFLRPFKSASYVRRERGTLTHFIFKQFFLDKIFSLD